MWDGKNCDNKVTCSDNTILPWLCHKPDQATHKMIFKHEYVQVVTLTKASALVDQLELYVQWNSCLYILQTQYSDTAAHSIYYSCLAYIVVANYQNVSLFLTSYIISS